MKSEITRNSAGAEGLLLFGPQLPRLVHSRMSDVRTTILEHSHLRFLAPIINELPSIWNEAIVPSCPRLASHSGEQQLRHLVTFLETGTVPPLSKRANNIILAPLTVIAQIVEYIRLGRRGPVQGFCIGFLAAAAVACARTKKDLEQSVGTAIRLAVCIGAIIDMEEEVETEPQASYSSYSVQWKSRFEKQQLDATLDSFPQVNPPLPA